MVADPPGKEIAFESDFVQRIQLIWECYVWWRISVIDWLKRNKDVEFGLLLDGFTDNDKIDRFICYVRSIDGKIIKEDCFVKISLQEQKLRNNSKLLKHSYPKKNWIALSEFVPVLMELVLRVVAMEYYRHIEANHQMHCGPSALFIDLRQSIWVLHWMMRYNVWRMW